MINVIEKSIFYIKMFTYFRTCYVMYSVFTHEENFENYMLHSKPLVIQLTYGQKFLVGFNTITILPRWKT